MNEKNTTSGGVEGKLMGSYRGGGGEPFFMIVRGVERELCDDEVTPLIVNTTHFYVVEPR